MNKNILKKKYRKRLFKQKKKSKNKNLINSGEIILSKKQAKALLEYSKKLNSGLTIEECNFAIKTLSPEVGQFILNQDNNKYEVFDGEKFREIKANDNKEIKEVEFFNGEEWQECPTKYFSEIFMEFHK